MLKENAANLIYSGISNTIYLWRAAARLEVLCDWQNDLITHCVS